MKMNAERTPGNRRLMLVVCTALAPVLAPMGVSANPQGGAVVAGAATVSAAGNTMTINQASGRAIVNWQTFSIAPGETTRFVQPSAAAAILNRVTGADPSALMGQLSGNGRVYLINPNGIIVGPQGRVETGGFVASTRNVRDGDFMAGGPLKFDGASTAGVQVLGRITAATGDVVLVASRVENAGRIEAPQGQAILAAGGSLVYVPEGTGDLVIETPADGAAVGNSGAIEAAAVQLRAAGTPYALAIKNSGQVTATAVRNVGGRVVLEAGDGEAQVSGAITARQGQDGGQVSVHGGQVAITADGRIDVSGQGQGGGGAATVLATGATRFEGAIVGRGGEAGGDGGQAEVSGGSVAYLGKVDLGAPHGKTGRVLIDPATFAIDGSNVATIVSNLATADQSFSATSSLTVDAAVSSSSIHALQLNAPTISVNANINLPNGTLQFYNSGAAGPLSSASNATITAAHIYIPGNFSTANLQGAVITPDFSVDTGFSPTSFTATNTANKIDGLNAVQSTSLSGNLAVSSSTAMTVSGEFITSGALSMSSTHDLTMGASAVLAATGQITLAATGGKFVNNASPGTGLISGASRVVIYSNSTGFNDGGLGYPTFTNVNYPSDPQTGNVVYFNGVMPTLTITANDATRRYGQSNPAFSASYSGGLSSDLTTAVSFRVQGLGVNVGTYAIEPFGAASTTRTLAYVNGVLTITAAPLTITADGVSRVYGQANPAFGASYAGLVNGDTASAVSGLTLTSAGTAASAVGSYAIVPGGASAANYAITYVNGALTVTPATLTVTADSLSRLYGDANPTLSGSLRGLVNGDTASVVSGLSYTTSATTASNAGAYAVRVGGGAAANYVLAYVDGVLTVTPAPLTVTADYNQMQLGSGVPELYASYEGFRNGDGADLLNLTFSTDAATAAAVGEYPIHVTGSLRSGGNYALKFVDGTMGVYDRPNVTPPLLLGPASPTIFFFPFVFPLGPYAEAGPTPLAVVLTMTGGGALLTGLTSPLLQSLFSGDTPNISTLGVSAGHIGPYSQ